MFLKSLKNVSFFLGNESRTIYLDFCTMSQACTKGGIFINLIHSHLRIKKKKYQDQLSPGCFSECCGFKALLLCLCFGWRDRGRGWGSVGWGECQCGRK